jgi:glutamate dehydrogenase
VLLAYTKNEVAASLIASDAPEDPWLSRELEAYFPPALRGDRFAAAMAGHPLRREIIAAKVTNTLVARAGTTFVFRLGEEAGAPPVDLARTHAAARELFALDRFWADVDALDNQVAAHVQVDLALLARGLAERAARWLVRHGDRPLDVAAAVDAYGPGLATVEALLSDDGASRWEGAGVPTALALRAAALPRLAPGLEMVDVSRRIGAGVEAVAGVWFALGERLEVDWLRAQIVALPRDDRWQALARGALRDDCDRERAVLAAAVLATGRGLDDWIADHGPAVERFALVLEDVRALPSPDLATLSVAMREFRALGR